MKYTPSHEWIRTDGTVGITRYAQGELGEVVYVELPKVGHEVKAGQETCVIESTKAATDVYAPVSGKITAVNDTLQTNPALINQDAENKGWLYRIELSQPKELDKLLTQPQYEKLIKQ